MRAPITGRRIRPSSRLTVDGARSNRRATCRAPRPRARGVAIRWRSRSERHRWDGASSSRRTGGTPPRSARHRCPVVRVIQTLWHAPDRPHARHQQPPGVVETADDRRPAVSPRGPEQEVERPASTQGDRRRRGARAHATRLHRWRDHLPSVRKWSARRPQAVVIDHQPHTAFWQVSAPNHHVPSSSGSRAPIRQLPLRQGAGQPALSSG